MRGERVRPGKRIVRCSKRCEDSTIHEAGSSNQTTPGRETRHPNADADKYRDVFANRHIGIRLAHP
jgi:hypothetical protein